MDNQTVGYHIAFYVYISFCTKWTSCKAYTWQPCWLIREDIISDRNMREGVVTDNFKQIL